MAGNVVCNGVTAAGDACRRPPSRDRPYCLSHDPERKDDHAGISSMGGVARHDPAVSNAKAEIADVKAALWSRKISPGAASVLLQAMRLERELDAADKLYAANDTLITGIQSMRASGVPDMSEPANGPHGGVSEPVDEPEEPHDPDAPRLEDYDGRADEYLRDSAAHRAGPLSHLTVAERRQRLARNRA